MRRIGWVLVGAAATAAALWKVPAMRERLLGPDPVVELPTAEGGAPAPVWGPPVEPVEPAAAESDLAAPGGEPDVGDTIELEAVDPPSDEEADGLRGRIEETRARMRAKAQAEAERARTS